MRLKGMGFDSIIPMELIRKKSGNKFKELRKKLIPGYILVEMTNDEDDFLKLRSLREIVLHPTTEFVTEKQFEVLTSRDKSEAKTRADIIGIDIGDEIVFTTGVMMGIKGIIREINRKKLTVVVEINLFNRTTPMIVDIEHIEKI